MSYNQFCFVVKEKGYCATTCQKHFLDPSLYYLISPHDFLCIPVFIFCSEIFMNAHSTLVIKCGDGQVTDLQYQLVFVFKCQILNNEHVSVKTIWKKCPNTSITFLDQPCTLT